MRVLIGLDSDGAFWEVIDFVKKLAFENLEFDLVRVVESLLPDGSYPVLPDHHPLSQYYELQTKASQEMLDVTQAALAKSGIASRTFIYHGDAAQQIVSHADAEECDLIALRSTAKGKWGSLFYGSVSKGVLIGSSKSALIIKTAAGATAQLSAVLATDHSEYCDRCVDLLVSMRPKGIGKLTVMTSTAPAKLVHALFGKTPSIGDLSCAPVDEAEANSALCKRLTPHFPGCDSVVKETDPADAIAETMREAPADLLIVGAQGHGYFERLRLGSQSFHQVVNTTHNVLVLRLPATASPV